MHYTTKYNYAFVYVSTVKDTWSYCGRRGIGS